MILFASCSTAEVFRQVHSTERCYIAKHSLSIYKTHSNTLQHSWKNIRKNKEEIIDRTTNRLKQIVEFPLRFRLEIFGAHDVMPKSFLQEDGQDDEFPSRRSGVAPRCVHASSTGTICIVVYSILHPQVYAVGLVRAAALNGLYGIVSGHAGD
jgi:hypothetical protein